MNPESEDREMDKNFTFDDVFDGNSTQNEIFIKTAVPILENVLEG